MQTSRFAFLQSVRFWKLACVGVLAGATYVYPDSIWIHAAAITLGTWFGGSVAVGTLDKFSQAKVQAAQIASDTTEMWTMEK